MLKNHLAPNDCAGPVYSQAGRRVRGLECSALITSVASGALARLEFLEHTGIMPCFFRGEVCRVHIGMSLEQI